MTRGVKTYNMLQQKGSGHQQIRAMSIGACLASELEYSQRGFVCLFDCFLFSFFKTVFH